MSLGQPAETRIDFDGTAGSEATSHGDDAGASAQPTSALRRLIVVDDWLSGDSSASGANPARAERRQLRRRLNDAAIAAVTQPMLMAATLLLMQGLLALTMQGQWRGAVAVEATAAAAAAAAGVAVLMAAWAACSASPMYRSRRWRSKALHAVWALAVATSAWLAWATQPDSRMPPAALGLVFGVVGAALMAPLARAWPMAVPVPLLAGGAVASGTGQGVWWLAGASATLAAAMVGLITHRAWARRTKTLIAQADRLVELEREWQAAQRADQDKGRLLGIASHDLRQPVHAIGLFAATLQRRLQQSAEEPLARNLTRAVDGLERSFNAILDISRLDGGALVPKRQTFPLRDMFRRLHMQYAGQAELAGLGLRFSPGGKSVTSDPQLLERVVGNLVQNAIKYTERGGVVVVARNTRTRLNLEVWDTGAGIPGAELRKVFDEFYQIGRGERDRTHGLGMGLAIVKRLVALLGHRLEVASVPGRGTMFRVGLALDGLPGSHEDQGPSDTLPMPSNTPKMVLVIDDEEPIREGLRLLLQEWGYQVMTAANGPLAEEAVTALDGCIDLILSDLHLGHGPDGLQVIAQIRRQCGYQVPAILVTGETMIDEVQRLTAGSEPVLFKPVQPRRLFEAIRSALGSEFP